MVMITAASKPQTKRPTDERRRIVLVDDHAMLREGLAQAIGGEADLVVCGAAETAAEALEVIADTQPNLVIVDLALKDSDGLDLIKDIRARWPRLPVLVVSMHEDVLYAERALRSGASGYVTKREATRTLVRAIRRVLGGEIHLSDAVAAQIASQVVGATRPRAGLVVEKLSDRELQVFRLIGQGLSAREISDQLHLDLSTVDTYRARLKDKLGLANAGELLRAAIGWTHGSASL
jgi:DNA-binding NarL/FixJ family response regulator